MAAPKVLIIGCGVAGPVVALFIKRKGYSPIVLERSKSSGYEGSAPSLAPNGLKVLSALGLTAKLTDVVQYETTKDITWDGTLLNESLLSSVTIEKYGQPLVALLRSSLNRCLKDALSTAEIPLISEFKVSEIVEGEDQVTVVAEDGRTESGSFVIGCDGINSVVRASILKSHGLPLEHVDFTGIVQHRGISPTPRSMLKNANGIMFIYGPSSYVTYYPISSTSCLWALYQRPKVGTAEWPDTRFLTLAVQEVRRKELAEDLKDWPEFVKDAVSTSGEIIYLKLCDRPILPPEKWFSVKGRSVVLGDAAHALTPHSGQGANQALEDAWHLGQFLPDLTSSTTPSSADQISSAKLKAVFEAFALKRQPRMTKIMNLSKHVGDLKCPDSPEGEKRRGEYFKTIKFSGAIGQKMQDELFGEPF
ncbi:FAD/NAD(P)-binding domain-containing protein [Stipitochalara longipes BDJ]|nr:FAD/NAD(P)-binding domain-containing protein [Stipitochalara longipes BDJ]